MRETRDARLGATCRRRLWLEGDDEVGKAKVGAAVGGLRDLPDPAEALAEINRR